MATVNIIEGEDSSIEGHCEYNCAHPHFLSQKCLVCTPFVLTRTFFLSSCFQFGISAILIAFVNNLELFSNTDLFKFYCCLILSKVTEFVATVIEVPEEVSESLQTFRLFFSRLSYTIRHPDLFVQDLCEHGVIDHSTEVGGWKAFVGGWKAFYPLCG